MGILVGILIGFSGIMSMSGLAKEPLSIDEIYGVLYDCKTAGMKYSSVSDLHFTKPHSNLYVDELREYDGAKLPPTEVLETRQVHIFEQWCQMPDERGYSGLRSYWKKPIEHTVLMDTLRKCRRANDIANDTPIDEYARVWVGNLSLEPTKVECL